MDMVDVAYSPPASSRRDVHAREITHLSNGYHAGTADREEGHAPKDVTSVPVVYVFSATLPPRTKAVVRAYADIVVKHMYHSINMDMVDDDEGAVAWCHRILLAFESAMQWNKYGATHSHHQWNQVLVAKHDQLQNFIDRHELRGHCRQFERQVPATSINAATNKILIEDMYSLWDSMLFSDTILPYEYTTETGMTMSPPEFGGWQEDKRLAILLYPHPRATEGDTSTIVYAGMIHIWPVFSALAQDYVLRLIGVRASEAAVAARLPYVATILLHGVTDFADLLRIQHLQLHRPPIGKMIKIATALGLYSHYHDVDYRAAQSKKPVKTVQLKTMQFLRAADIHVPTVQTSQPAPLLSTNWILSYPELSTIDHYGNNDRESVEWFQSELCRFFYIIVPQHPGPCYSAADDDKMYEEAEIIKDSRTVAPFFDALMATVMLHTRICIEGSMSLPYPAPALARYHTWKEDSFTISITGVFRSRTAVRARKRQRQKRVGH
jgi:hypothetical protein